MRIRRVNRYYCEFCKKAGCSGFHMKKHEDGCTLNPNRICRVCKMIDGVQEPIAELMSLLPERPSWLDPDPEEPFWNSTRTSAFTASLNAALPALREKCSNCPACIMAALRQKRIPVPMATDFSWTNEMQAVWNNINTANWEGISA